MVSKSKSVFITLLFIACLLVWGCSSEEEVQKPAVVEPAVVINEPAIALIRPSDNIINPDITEDELRRINLTEIEADSVRARACFDTVQLALMYIEGIYIPIDKVQARLWLQKAIDKGDSGAIVLLRILSECETDNLAANFTRSLEAYLKSRDNPDQSDARAMMYLADCYGKELGIELNEQIALSWVIKAAQAGDVNAMNYLGDAYGKEGWLGYDAEKAEFWLKKAAKGGDAAAMFDLGIHYAHGEGVPIDKVKSAYWHQQGVKHLIMDADKGDVNAMGQLGHFYRMTRHKDYDIAKSDHWHKKEADIYLPMAQKGNIRAMSDISFMYELGLGLSQNNIEAYAWNQAANEINKRVRSKGKADWLSKDFTPEQIEQAQKRAKEIVAGIKAAKKSD